MKAGDGNRAGNSTEDRTGEGAREIHAFAYGSGRC